MCQSIDPAGKWNPFVGSDIGLTLNGNARTTNRAKRIETKQASIVDMMPSRASLFLSLASPFLNHAHQHKAAITPPLKKPLLDRKTNALSNERCWPAKRLRNESVEKSKAFICETCCKRWSRPGQSTACGSWRGWPTFYHAAVRGLHRARLFPHVPASGAHLSDCKKRGVGGPCARVCF